MCMIQIDSLVEKQNCSNNAERYKGVKIPGPYTHSLSSCGLQSWLHSSIPWKIFVVAVVLRRITSVGEECREMGPLVHF